MSMKLLKNAVKHTILVTKHKWLVFKFCCKLGMPIRGLMHDMSKFSPVEFFESIKYYDGKVTPIEFCKKDKGYSLSWLHHKGRNKHHDSYWVDLSAPQAAPVIPYKYVIEMLCDKLSASITYNGKDWTNSSEYDYWQIEKKRIILNPKVENFLSAIITEIKDNGIDKVLTKKHLKEQYKKYCIDDTREYKYVFHGQWQEVEK